MLNYRALTLAKAEGYELTTDEAEAYMAELADFELDEASLKNVAGGFCYDESAFTKADRELFKKKK